MVGTLIHFVDTKKLVDQFLETLLHFLIVLKIELIDLL
jgi:hypothetical protein